MKTLVCGKGGSGKSTISALLAKAIAEENKEVLVMDTDESNSGLHNKLGIEPSEDFMYYFGGKEVLHDKIKELQDDWKISEIPERFLSQDGNIRLLTMGKIYDFGEGCACPINELSSKFLEKINLEKNEYLIADTDAGIEHLGRGVDKGCDILLAVVDPSRESLDLSKKIMSMAEDIDIKVYYVLNKVDEQEKEILLNSIDENKVLASVPKDERISKHDLEGRKFDFRVEEISKLTDLLKNNKQKSRRGRN